MDIYLTQLIEISPGINVFRHAGPDPASSSSLAGLKGLDSGFRRNDNFKR
jgi:hypothetical protein